MSTADGHKAATLIDGTAHDVQVSNTEQAEQVLHALPAESARHFLVEIHAVPLTPYDRTPCLESEGETGH